LPRYLPDSDFRAIRKILEPQDFAYGSDTPDPPPADPVDKDTWNGIEILPDDVSIRTSNHHGRLLKSLHDLWGFWVAAVDEEQDELYVSILDASDEFQAATFNSLHGYYRQSLGVLRNAFETITIGTYFKVSGNHSEFEQWRNGQIELPFGRACDQLSIQPLNLYLRSTLGESLFDQRTEISSGGWARRLYSELSRFAHSRPGFTDGDMWQSNGPIYAPDAFIQFSNKFFEVSVMCCILVKLGRPKFVLSKPAIQLFELDTLPWHALAVTCQKYLFTVS
jgi:hypothetical protein